MSRVFTIVLLAVTAVILAGCGQAKLYQDLDNAQLQGMLDQGVPIIDIRRPEEWKQTGVIEGSKKLTFVDGSGRLKPNFLPAFTGAISPDEPVILICRTGNRTSVLARHLTEELGYSQVYNVRDGITSWKRNGGPVNPG